MIGEKGENQAAQTLLSDLVENILKYSDNTGACAEYLTSQIRELIGVRMVALVSNETGKGHKVEGVCPQRKQVYWNQQPELQQFITGALEYVEPRLIHPKTDPAGETLSAIGIGTSFVIPLMVGAERVGLLILLDLLDQRGAAIILETLASVARILALILKNSLLYRDMEQQVAERTEELHVTNVQLQRELAERKQVEADLRKSEDRFRRLAENAPDMIYRMSLPDGKYEYINSASLSILGYSPEEIYHNNFLIKQLIHPDWQVYLQEQWENLLKGEMPPTYEYQCIHKSGQIRWLNQRNILVCDDAGDPIAIEGIVTDITDSKQAEAKLRKLNEELDQRVLARTAELEAANKEMHAFSYTVSHDLRAPLRHIDSYIGLLRKKLETALDKQSHHYMDTISNAAQKMGLLIDNLLSFSRMGRQALSFQPVELGTLVLDVIRELEADVADRNIGWHIGDLPVVGGDGAMLRLVLTNLIANALKFTRPRQQARIEIGSLSGQNAEIVIFVRDNGVGFDMAYLDKLFGVFHRLHRAEEFEGTGIGLANVHRIIARHGGRVWAKGEIDRGATFYFSLSADRCLESVGGAPFDKTNGTHR